jgi:enediyne polyketide synthase
MSSERIAIVGIGLRFPDAGSPEDLWHNVLAGRRAFRRIPDERMNRADYWSAERDAPDRFYATKAAVLRDFVFDRMKYKVAGSTYRSTDLTHWLALDVASAALADAGFPDGAGLPKQSTGVVLGNSLTGEFARANLMRLRWPYVRRTLAAALAGKDWTEQETSAFLADLEVRYKAPFPGIDEDSLAGGLANTMAGRICNYYGLTGGGYTVDGACSSSLLSVATAARGLTAHDFDVVIAGGVDLSIDPFEVIGFAKLGTLTPTTMKVYDRDSNGFWPGEGAGLVVLMREDDALARGARIYASITGWAISSDGKGNITRPEVTGQRLALSRAYDRAGYGIGTVSYFEGHGTGTSLGDTIEIEALSSARRDADWTACPAALSTIKGNIGHTKAASGSAALIKATLAVYHQVIPPATGHDNPHPSLLGDEAAMYVPHQAELWPTNRPIRAGVSAMGFGGINAHVALENTPNTERREVLDARTLGFVAGRQDAELLLFDGFDAAALRERVALVAKLAPKLAMAELADLAGTLAQDLSGREVRAAIVACSPEEAEDKLGRLLALLDSGESSAFATQDGIFLDSGRTAPRIGYLFPGQGSGKATAGALRRRFAVAEGVFRDADVPTGGDQVATEVAQPRIVTGSLAGLAVLRLLGITAETAVGHSLGELTALHWGGAMDAATLLALVRVRGKVMASASLGGGAMAGMVAGPDTVEHLEQGEDVVIAGYNAPNQTVISGPRDAVDRVTHRARDASVSVIPLNVSHAFHSPLVEPAAIALADELTRVDFTPLTRSVVSSVTSDVLDTTADLRELLHDQVLRPVRFHEAAAKVAAATDLLIEVGPGRVLTDLVEEIAPGKPVLSVHTDNGSLAALLMVVGAAYTLGTPVDIAALFADRLIRPLALDAEMTFLASPCETAPAIDADLVSLAGNGAQVDQPSSQSASSGAESVGGSAATLEILRTLAADRVELPVDMITAETLPLDDLHLSSITVGQIVNDATRELGYPVLEATSNFATVSLGDLAEVIDNLAQTAHDSDGGDSGEPPGVAPWVWPFSVDHVEQAAPEITVDTGPANDAWTVFASPDHPLAEPLRAALADAGVGDGVLLCLPADGGAAHIELFLEVGRAVMAAPPGNRLVVVQHLLGASGLARTLRFEADCVVTTLVDLADPAPTGPADITAAVAHVVAEVAATTGFSEVRYDAAGTRTVPMLCARPAPPSAPGPSPLDTRDVVLVTGGGKGITAECALAVATDSGAALALLGRADPADSAELTANLSRMEAAGIRFKYERADVTSAEQVKAAIDRMQAELGLITAVLHGAGRNEPRALPDLTDEDFQRTVAPKIDGLRNVLAAIDADRLKLLITFGSIIGRAGLRGEAHYATANDWMTELACQFHREQPQVRTLALEWSVWSGAGMGDRLGVVEKLMRDGITPISTESGVAVLRQLLADPSVGPVVVVCGRVTGLSTLTLYRPELALRRFVERVQVYYPGIELITEAELSVASDPYLGDHLLAGDLLFPAVIGMEAMAQVVAAVTGQDGPLLLEDVEFLRPVVVPADGSTIIRLAALVKDAETVDLVVRSSDTDFSADHFRATARLPRPAVPGERAAGKAVLPLVPIDPSTELYGGMLFQGKRFQRVLAYRQASARRAVVEISTRSSAPWFAAYQPQDRLLADPGARDAVMHAIQCCVPDATLLPQGIEKVYLADRDRAGQDDEYVVLDARERSQDGDSYTYDLDVRDPSGDVVERWEGLTLRAVRKQDGAGPWVPSLLGPYLERAVERFLRGSRTIVVEPDPRADTDPESTPRAQTELAVSRALGRTADVQHSPNGKPTVEGIGVSASHGAGLTLAVVGPGGPGCDIEPVVDRSEADWAGLLGAEQLAVRDRLVAEAGETSAVAGTRVWSALECIRKAGATTQSLTVDRVDPDGWALLSAGDAAIATWVTTVNDRPGPIVFAVLAGEKD